MIRVAGIRLADVAGGGDASDPVSDDDDVHDLGGREQEWERKSGNGWSV